MRVITGTARGRRLKSVRGVDTRPTLDRVKESLFNIIRDRLYGVKFLDLFAGTGSIGIEALSRGADCSVFVEYNPGALAVIGQNLETTKTSDKAEVISMDALRSLDMLARYGRKFDIIFMDPPYKKDLVQRCLAKIDQFGLLSEGGLIIAESGKKDNVPEESGSLKRFRQEKYGDTVLSFYQEIVEERG